MNTFAITDLLSLVNVALGLLVCYTQLKLYNTYPKQWRWLKASYAVVGFYWALAYTVIFSQSMSGNYSGGVFSATFVRPGLTITLGIIAASAIFRIRSWR